MPRAGASGTTMRLTCPHGRSIFLLVWLGAARAAAFDPPPPIHSRSALRAHAHAPLSSLAMREAAEGAVAAASAPLRKPERFLKDFSQPMAIPEDGIAAAVDVMRSGRLFRYCATDSQVTAAEAEFAGLVEHKYALGVNSCSSAIMLAMILVGVQAGDEVLTNGFTFTALPSTIMRLHATPVLVETTRAWTMDLDDLEEKAAASKAKVLLLSHMRGRVCDMDRVVEICEKHGLTLIEDCAHGCGVLYRKRQLGFHGVVSCYSTQSDKVINSGEGGFLTTSSDEMMAKAIYLSGAYEGRYSQHDPRPPKELCEAAMLSVPNLSCRMSELTAAVMRPLIKNLPERVVRYNERYALVVDTLSSLADGIIVVPEQLPQVEGVGDHLNFYLDGVTAEQNAHFMAACHAGGVPVSWFCSPVNARWHVNWRMYGSPEYELPQTDDLLATAYDLKLPPHFEDRDMRHIAEIIAYAANLATGRVSANQDDSAAKW
mmetsp:Transcript_17293/g.41355  ORF Transcript_17293/g.41355 Transcript_17293/m.41355 type:complete len:486 (-) Transcript_17293:162-1619(-)